MKKIMFFGFFWEKNGKISKKVKTDQNGSDIDGKGQKWWKMKTNNIFWIFWEKYGKISKKVKTDENGSDIDEKWKK